MQIEDPRYGKIYARYDSWGYGKRNEKLQTHPCTEEELGLAEDKEKSRFYPIHPNFKKDFENQKQKLMCFDDPIKINGDYNSEKAQRL